LLPVSIDWVPNSQSKLPPWSKSGSAGLLMSCAPHRTWLTTYCDSLDVNVTPAKSQKALHILEKNAAVPVDEIACLVQMDCMTDSASESLPLSISYGRSVMCSRIRKTAACMVTKLRY